MAKYQCFLGNLELAKSKRRDLDDLIFLYSGGLTLNLAAKKLRVPDDILVGCIIGIIILSQS